MASTVAGAIKWISSTLIDEGKYLYGVEDHLRNLQRDLRYMHLFLQKVEANPKPLRDDDPLLILTEEMRDLAIRAEDAVSIYRVDVESHFRSTNFLSKACCLASHSYPVHVLRTEIDAIQTEIEEALRRSEKFGKHIQNLEHQQGSAIGPSSSRPNPENFLHLDNEFVVGIKEDISNLVKRLTNPEDDFRVLGIVGTGGAGKSTLATQIYRHKEVQSWFSHKVFVCVSQEWDSIDLLSRIYKQIMQVSDTPSDKNVLLKTLHDFMKDKRSLVVLEDLWDKIAYNAIHPIFPHTEGIRIIITTRKKEVILHADTKGISHVPKLLTKEEMLELFKKIAVDGREDIVKDDRYLKLGVQMLEKIEGLPLAVVTLAGILRTKRHLNEWKRINEACSSNILIEDAGLKYGAVKEMLGLSYLDLPTHVKPCFLYLGIIPEDGEFLCETMAQMWTAEGFITDDLRMGEETLEDVAMRVLDELAQRCVLQITNHPDKGEIFRIHDLMREFCITTASQCSFLKVVTSTNPDARARRLSICSREYDPQENQHLRTLVFLNEWSQYDQQEVKKLESIDKQFKVLRVLNIQSMNCALSKNIGKLVNLTYLSLVNTGMTIFPESIRNLRNLLYFKLCKFTAVLLPNNLVGNMENLRSLDLPVHLKKLDSLGFSNGRHKKLHTLSCGGGRWMRKDLPALSSSLLNLQILGIENAEELQALSSFLNHNLCTLALRVEGEAQFDLDKLRDCQNLWRLYFEGPVANLVVSFELPSNLTHLGLSKTKIGEGVDLLEALGRLSQLKVLHLGDDAFVGEKLSCESGAAFPKLQELRLWGLNCLEEWEMERGAMKVLRKIQILVCKRLKKLPECIRYIYTLEELEARGMSEEFVKRYEGYGGVAEPGVICDDYKIIQHIPSVNIRLSFPGV